MHALPSITLKLGTNSLCEQRTPQAKATEAQRTAELKTRQSLAHDKKGKTKECQGDLYCFNIIQLHTRTHEKKQRAIDNLQVIVYAHH